MTSKQRERGGKKQMMREKTNRGGEKLYPKQRGDELGFVFVRQGFV
jgi:hypothetical protein